MAYNPNAVFISPSSLADFEKCSQLYYYRSVYKTPRGLKIQLINPALALGQVMHDILAQFVFLPKESKNKEELFRIFDIIWSGISGEKGGFSSAEEENEYKKRAESMLQRFLRNTHFLQEEPVRISGFPKVELGNDLILTGKIDWIEKEGNGYHVIDFKTGKNEEKEDSLQLPIYAFLVSKYFNTESVRTSYWYLDKNDEIVPFTLPKQQDTEDMLKKKGEIIKMVRQTNSFRCQSGGESCWACRDILAVAQGRGKLVSMDPVNRKQEIYILPKENLSSETTPNLFAPAEPEDLPF